MLVVNRVQQDDNIQKIHYSIMYTINILHKISTYDESQQLVGQQAGGDEGHQETNVQLLSQLWLNPHKQTANTHTQAHTQHLMDIMDNELLLPRYKKRKKKKKENAGKLTSWFSPGCSPSSQTDSVGTDTSTRMLWCCVSLQWPCQSAERLPFCLTWAFWATSRTSWNFSDTVRSSFGGSWGTDTDADTLTDLHAVNAWHQRLRAEDVTHHGLRDFGHDAPLNLPAPGSSAPWEKQIDSSNRSGYGQNCLISFLKIQNKSSLFKCAKGSHRLCDWLTEWVGAAGVNWPGDEVIEGQTEEGEEQEHGDDPAVPRCVHVELPSKKLQCQLLSARKQRIVNRIWGKAGSSGSSQQKVRKYMDQDVLLGRIIWTVLSDWLVALIRMSGPRTHDKSDGWCVARVPAG